MPMPANLRLTRASPAQRLAAHPRATAPSTRWATCHPNGVTTARLPPVRLGNSSIKGLVMSEPFRGVVNLDIRESTPDWAPFSQPVAPPGTPNVVYVVLDDVGFGALGCYGGAISTPERPRRAATGARSPPGRTTPPCSPPRP